MHKWVNVIRNFQLRATYVNNSTVKLIKVSKDILLINLI